MSESAAVTAIKAHAVLKGDGVAVVNLDGENHQIKRANDDEAMRSVMRLLTGIAQERSTVITLTTQDETGAGRLVITPDGRVSAGSPPATSQPVSASVAVVPPPKDSMPVVDFMLAAEAAASATPTAETALPSRRELRTARDFAETKRPVKAESAELGIRGVINKISGGALQIGPSARELELRAYRESIQRGIRGHRSIAFVNLKGGSSKTTCTYLVGATLGRIRGGNILGWDNNENKGTLGDRAIRASHDHTAIDLLENIDDFASPANAPHLINYVRPQGENKFHVLASQDRGSERPVIDGQAFTKLHRALRTFYHLILVDTGNASNASTWQAAVAEADEIVIVTLNREDSAKTAASTIDDLVKQGHADKLAKGVAIITEVATPTTEQRKAAAERMQRLRDHLSGYVREIVIIPNDTALDDGDEILYEKLSRATQKAFIRATSAIIDGL